MPRTIVTERVGVTTPTPFVPYSVVNGGIAAALTPLGSPRLGPSDYYKYILYYILGKLSIGKWGFWEKIYVYVVKWRNSSMNGYTAWDLGLVQFLTNRAESSSRSVFEAKICDLCA